MAVQAETRDPKVVLVDVAKSRHVPRTSSGKSPTRKSGGGGASPSAPSSPTKKFCCVASGCRNERRANQVYCSDACIVAHARDSLQAMSKLEATAAAAPDSPTTPGKWKESLEFGQLMSQTTPAPAKSKALKKPANLADDAPVPVVEHSTGKILVGSFAPKVAHLEQWLKDNPTFQVVKPNNLPKGRLTNSRPTATSASPGTPTASGSPASTTPSSKSSGSRKTPQTAEKPPKVVRKKSIETPAKEQQQPESTRSVSKSSFKEILWHRCKESEDLAGKLTEADAEALAGEIEEAMYRLFNKDVGTKYKSKYRTLIFNMKDAKNEGLFRQIIERQIQPAQLVKMTAEEMASKELAEWREREAKHQLDMIQKTELEMMSMSNKVLLKTHKGEEVIEDGGKELALEAERTETAILSSDVNEAAGGKGDAGGLELLQDTTDRHASHLFDLNCRICSGQLKEGDKESSSPSKLAKSSSTEEAKSKSSSSRHHHSSSSSKKKTDKDHKKDHHHSKERRHSSASKSKDSSSSRSAAGHHRSHHGKHKSTDKDRKKTDAKKDDEPPAKEATVPVDPAVDMEVTQSTNESAVSEPSAAQPIKTEEEPVVVKQEPTSTVSIK